MESTVWVALIAVGGTIGSAGLSYLGSRHNTETQLRTAKQSTEVQLASVRIELKRLEDAQAEELRSARQRIYQDYLHAAYAYRDFFIGVSSPVDGSLGPAARSFLEREIEMELLASEPVRERAEALYDFLWNIVKTAESGHFPKDMDDGEQLQAAYNSKKDEWRTVRDRLVNAMRAELASSTPSPSTSSED